MKIEVACPTDGELPQNAISTKPMIWATRTPRILALNCVKTDTRMRIKKTALETTMISMRSSVQTAEPDVSKGGAWFPPETGKGFMARFPSRIDRKRSN